MNGTFDLVHALENKVSVASEQVAAGTITGTYVDMDAVQGPVTALCNVGTASGTPDSFSATFTLLEADTSGGTGSQAIPVQDDALVLSADKATGLLSGRRTKRYVAVKCVLAITGGTTPKQSAFANVLGQKARV